MKLPSTSPLRSLPRAVLALGVVSMLTDISGEMIFPLLPAFLAATLGAGPAILGIIEGIADSTSSIVKVASGWWTDAASKRKPLIVLGYTVSSLARPLIGLAASWWFVLAMRFCDRVGKGIRTSPRDALIADVTAPELRGAAYGFHRAMDHTGAVIGPLIALLLIKGFDVSVRHVFLLAGIPALLVIVALVIGVQEPARVEKGKAVTPAELHAGWREFGRDFKLLMAALFVFTLGNATDAFLLMRLNDVGISAGGVALLWSMHHVLKSVSSFWSGRASDLVGPRRMILLGWGLYAVVYLLFGFLESKMALSMIFLVYAIHFGLAEPCEKAWVAALAPKGMRGTAFGYYHGVIGLGVLPASLLFGFLWQFFGAPAAFIAGAIFAGIGSAMLLRVGGGDGADGVLA